MKRIGLAGMVAACLALPTQVSAQAAGGSLGLELNAAQPTDKGCRLVFVVKNDVGKAISRAGVEFALFNAAGVVDRLTVLEFKDLAAGKTKVSRFELSGVKCTDLSRLLVNGVTACEGEGVDVAACQAGLKLSNKSNLAFDS